MTHRVNVILRMRRRDGGRTVGVAGVKRRARLVVPRGGTCPTPVGGVGGGRYHLTPGTHWYPGGTPTSGTTVCPAIYTFLWAGGTRQAGGTPRWVPPQGNRRPSSVLSEYQAVEFLPSGSTRRFNLPPCVVPASFSASKTVGRLPRICFASWFEV